MKQQTMLVTELKRLAIEKQRPLWKRVAVELEKPSRQRRTINLWRIDRVAKEGETLLVPGKVLGDGLLTKKVTLAAASYSQEALQKIAAAGGQPLTIEQLMQQRPDGKDVRVIA